MGAGGAAPPVKGHDVMILVGSSILLVTFILHTWVDPVEISGSENWSKVFEMSEGDDFSIEVETGELNLVIMTPDGLTINEWAIDGDYTYTADQDGAHTFTLTNSDDSSSMESVAKFSYTVSRSLPISFLLYPIGALILGFGIWKKKYNEEEIVDAVLED
ncbi:MAG: hypothetical protein QGI21_01415 [Candidatus Poseidoniaceae archaeon]|jgi:hypothetical protein|nr:hypothetical protein [Candidatus Poseidoniaceae archaeon]